MPAYTHNAYTGDVWIHDDKLRAAVADLLKAEREACAKIAEAELGGYLCPYGRDKPGDKTWNHTDADKCPVCGADGAGSLTICHDTASGRIAAAIRARSEIL